MKHDIKKLTEGLGNKVLRNFINKRKKQADDWQNASDKNFEKSQEADSKGHTKKAGRLSDISFKQQDGADRKYKSVTAATNLLRKNKVDKFLAYHKSLHKNKINEAKNDESQ